MKFLAIDTVFDKCSVAIMVDGDIIHLQEQTGKRLQTQQILPMIDEAMRATGLKLSEFSALVFNRGPGAFSSIRINTAVVQALSVAMDLPCVGVSSLQVLAQAGLRSSKEQYSSQANSQQASDQLAINHVVNHAYAVIDARMSQVYIAEYKLDDASGVMQPISWFDTQTKQQQKAEYRNSEYSSAESLLDYDKPTDKTLTVIGDMAEDLIAIVDEQTSLLNISPTAADLVVVGQAQFIKDGGVPAEQALPIYVRKNTWKTLKEQGKG